MMPTRHSPYSWILYALVSAGFAGPAVGQARPQSSQPLELGAGVEIVTVDAVVLDKKGQPVRGLGPQDFVITEKGVPQEIVNFEAVDLAPGAHDLAAPSTRPAPDPRFPALKPQAEPTGNLDQGPAASPATPVRAATGRRLMIVFDDLHLTQRSAIRGRKIVADFLDTGLSEDDRVRLTSTSGVAAWAARAPEGVEDLKRFLSHLEGQRSTRHTMDMTDYEAMRIALYSDQRLLRDVAWRLSSQGLLGGRLTCGLPAVQAEARLIEQRNRTALGATLSRLQREISAAGTERGRKILFLVSEGFLDDLDLPAWRAVLDAARRANVVLYFVDPGTDRAVDVTGGAEVYEPVPTDVAGDFYSRLSLDSRGGATLAYATGGDALRNDMAAADAMTEIVDRSRVYYLLAFEPRSQKRDGKFHKLRVEVPRPDVKVIAREGYYAPKDGKFQKPETGGQLLQAIDSPIDSRAIPLRLATYVLGPAANDRVALLVAAEIDGSALVLPEEGKPDHQHLDWALAAMPRDGGKPVVVGWPMDLDLTPADAAFFGRHGLPTYHNFELAPGTYQLRVAVDDGGRVGSVTRTLEVPSRDSFRISTPILSDSAQPATGDRPPQPIPVAHREFPSGTTLLCLYGVYGAKVDPATGAPRIKAGFSVGLVGHDPVIDRAPTELQPASDGSVAETIPLVLRGAAPGQYAMAIRVEDLVGGTSTESREIFTVR
jgi:VWFA-related protein